MENKKTCTFCNSMNPKTSELPLDTLLLCQLTKYRFLSELIKLENQSHCVQEFSHTLKMTKEPHSGIQLEFFRYLKDGK